MRTSIGRGAAVALAISGGLLAPLAAYGLAAGAPAGRDPAPLRRIDVAAVSVQRTVYAPGQSSGWHAHTGIHTVVIHSGTLTVYDGSCSPRTFGADDPYTGGMDLHLARNESDIPVEMTVVSVRASGAAVKKDTLAQQPPEGCPLLERDAAPERTEL